MVHQKLTVIYKEGPRKVVQLSKILQMNVILLKKCNQLKALQIKDLRHDLQLVFKVLPNPKI